MATTIKFLAAKVAAAPLAAANAMTTMKTALMAALAAAAFVAHAGTFYVATDGNDGASGDSEHPFATIAAGVMAAGGSTAPRKVIVRTGEYKITEVISIPNAEMTIESETKKPEDVVIDGQGVTPVLKWANWNGGITVSGITVANGFLGHGNKDIWESAGISMKGGTVTNCIVRDCVISAGAAAAEGAGIKAASEVACRIYDTIVRGCVVSNYNAGTGSVLVRGGGILLFRNCIAKGCVVEDCKVQYCCSIERENAGGYSGSAGGGGIYALDGALIYDTVVRNCIATNAYTTGWAGGGGGIYAASGTVVSNCLVYGCFASSEGGGIIANGSTVTHCTISNNTVSPIAITNYRLGGGVNLQGTGAKLQNSIVRDNRVLQGLSTSTLTRFGGGGVAIASNGGNVVADCLVENNSAYGGGGFCIARGEGGAVGGVISNCLVRGNSASATTTGGGAFLSYCADGALVTDCVITGNTASFPVFYGSSGNANYPGGMTFRNCFMTGNSTEARTADTTGLFGGNFAHTYQRPLVIDHCTVAGNTVYQKVIRINSNAVSNFHCRANVFFDNRQSSGATYPAIAAASLESSTNAWYNFTDSTGFSTDPQYGNSAALTATDFADAANGDYRLVMASSARDKGGPVKDWMGSGLKNGPRDMGDGTMTVVPDGGYGINIVRNNALPRLKNLPEPGCFELWFPKGIGISFK